MIPQNLNILVAVSHDGRRFPPVRALVRAVDAGVARGCAAAARRVRSLRAAGNEDLVTIESELDIALKSCREASSVRVAEVRE